MTHRVHTILSLLAEDHAPAALRPSILLAVDWPTVAEEAPATGDDSGIACAASGILSGIGGRENLPALTLATLPLLAARLATVAASLTTTGDKAMAAHADALWGAAAALVGMPTEVREVPLAARVTHWRAMVQARDTALGALGWDGAENLQAWTAHQKATLENIREALGACTGETAMGAAVRVAEGYRSFKSAHAEMCVKFRDEGALVNTQIINERDRALADIHALRDILKVPEGGNLVDHASAFAERHMRRVDDSTAEAYRVNAENTRLRAQVDRMSAAMREDAPAPVKARPQPGDVVPWDEVEDKCLYYDRGAPGCCFLACTDGRSAWLFGPDDGDIMGLLRGTYGSTDRPRKTTYAEAAVLVARNLGSDPEAWRKAMREWTANGNKPTSKAAPKAAEDVLPLRDEFTRSIDLTGAWMCLMTGPLGNNGARWSLETTIGNTNNLRMRWPSGCTTTLKDPR